MIYIMRFSALEISHLSHFISDIGKRKEPQFCSQKIIASIFFFLYLVRCKSQRLLSSRLGSSTKINVTPNCNVITNVNNASWGITPGSLRNKSFNK